jgi:hypothetical protein
MRSAGILKKTDLPAAEDHSLPRAARKQFVGSYFR